jgi:hypothetical protein
MWIPALIAEVHLLLCPAPQELERALQLLGAGGSPDETVQVAYVDTPELDYHAAGWIFRVELKNNGKGKVTVKHRESHPVAPLECEEDHAPGRVSHGCSLKETIPAALAGAVQSGHQPLSAALSSEQKKFMQTAGFPPKKVERVFGTVLKREWDVKSLRVEHWSLPRGEWLLELSTRVDAAQAPQTLKTLEQRAGSLGIPVCVDQSSKTQRVLEATN